MAPTSEEIFVFFHFLEKDETDTIVDTLNELS